MEYEAYVWAQRDRQTVLRNREPVARLNFSPFQPALDAISSERISWLDGVIRTASVLDLRQLLADGSLSSYELVLGCVARIQKHDWLRALTAINPHALDHARLADANRKEHHNAPSGRLLPILGIPVLLKDNIGTSDGMPNTAGAAALQNVLCDRDAFLVQRIRAAGGIIIGKANLSEWANFFADSEREQGKPPNGFSAVGGQTRNPYGNFDVGGSSSGSASAVAAGLAPLAVGTETYGSITYPALRNSICGFKPSVGLVSRDRIIPITDATDTAGPMTRSVTDACALLDVLIGCDDQDSACLFAQTLHPGIHSPTYSAGLRTDYLTGMRVGVLQDYDGRAGSDQLVQAARGAFLRAGANLIHIDDPLKWEGEVFTEIMNYGFKNGVPGYLRQVGAPISSLDDIMAFNNKDMEARAPNGMGRMQSAASSSLTSDRYSALVAQTRLKAGNIIGQTMQRHRVELLVSFGQSGVGPHFVLAGAPLLSLPAGYYTDGEPFGVTLAARPFDDKVVLAAGFALEQRLPRRREPALRNI